MGEEVAGAPAKVLDFKGLLCPIPVVKLARAIGEIELGQTIEAFVTDPSVTADIPAWTRISGHELVVLENQKGQFRVVVRRKV